MTNESIRVRFAPSPTGALHIGGARTAYFNWLFARKLGGQFVLRIDDTDTARSTEVSYRQILDSFRWLGIDWDEGPDKGGPHAPYRQSERSAIYEEALEQLVAEGMAYPCFCSGDQLAAEREKALAAGITPRYSGHCRHLSEDERKARIERGDKHAYRLIGPGAGETIVHDIIRGDVVFQNDEIDDFVIWKSEGGPTYHFASCVDDSAMEITHIIRAEEHLSNTPRHVVLFRALGKDVPLFAHVPMILAPDRSKLSKRHGATSVEEYRDLGILPEALVNYLLLLGFSPGEDAEIVTREQAVQLFDLDRVAKHAAVYDVKKLEWLNGHYLRSVTVSNLALRVWDKLKERGFVQGSETRTDLAWLLRLVSAMQVRAKNLVDLVDNLEPYFSSVETYEEKGVQKHFREPVVAERIDAAAAALCDVSPYVAPAIEARYQALISDWGIKAGELIHPTRLALTGRTTGPGLYDVMELLGRDECVERMMQAAKWIREGMN